MKSLIVFILIFLSCIDLQSQEKNEIIIEGPLIGVTYQRLVYKHVKIFYNTNVYFYNSNFPDDSPNVYPLGANFQGSVINSVFSEVETEKFHPNVGVNSYVGIIDLYNEHNLGIYFSLDSLLKNKRLDFMIGPFVNRAFVDVVATAGGGTATITGTNERFQSLDQVSYRGWLKSSFGVQMSLKYKISGKLFGGIRLGIFDLYDTAQNRSPYPTGRLQLGVKF